jgi:hypothetical protein
MSLDIDAQYELANKIQTLIMFVGLLKPEEIDGIKQMRDQVEDNISSLSAISGTITPFEESENKIAHYRVIIKRCDAILAIAESNKDMADADAEFEASKKGRDEINALFGLGK